ncbi:MAG: cytochrome b/b6 domain-containing protein [Rubrivivax sp.]|nr:cytochrome b/b6 domain-containing protein [Rubrivivax sp.]
MARRRVLVWDAPVRVFHWLTVLSFAGAWITAESERWRLLHVTLGYTLAGLVAFRLVWGLVGTRHARFANFVRGPQAVMAHLRDMVQGRFERHAGHNPAGALAIVALLGTAVALTLSGWALFDGPGGDWLEDVHEGAANAMLALVGLHLAGVALASWLGRENLVGTMFSGRKDVAPAEGIRSAWRSVAALMVIAVAGFWVWQWQTAPAALDAPGASISADRDDD